MFYLWNGGGDDDDYGGGKLSSEYTVRGTTHCFNTTQW
jgi:hypothetical protein